MDVLQYSERPIHRGGQMPANGQNFDPSVAALVSSMRQDLVPDSSTPLPNGYSSFSPNSSQMDIYSPVSQADFRSPVSPVSGTGYKVQDVSYDFGLEGEPSSRKHSPNHGRTSLMVNGRGFMITGTPSPRSSLDGTHQATGSHQHHYQRSHPHHHHLSTKQQGDGGLINNNNNSYVTYNGSREYSHHTHPSNMAPQNGYVSPPTQSYHPVTTYYEEIQFGTSGTVGSDGVVLTPAQLCHSAVAQNGVSAPDNVGTTAIQPKPPSSLKPRGSRTRRSLRRAADMLLNRSRQSLSDTEGKGSKVMTPVPPPTASPRTRHSPADMPGSEDNRAPSVRERLQKNRACMGELLRSPSLSKWRRGSKENLDLTDSQPNTGSPSSNTTSPAYVPNRRYRSAENLNTSSYTSYETPDPYLDSRTDGSYLDSSDGMSTRSVESTPSDYPLRHQERRHSSGHTHHRTRSKENHRGYHTADSDTDSSYSRHDGMNGDSQSRYNSKRPIPSSFRLLSKGNRDGPMRTTPKGPSGPLKADHSIQPFSKDKRSPDEGSPRDIWAEQGARPKHHSSTDSLETEQVTHIVFQDTPIRNDSDDKNGSSRPTTPSALRKSSRPPSPSRSVRFDDDTDGSYDSDRRERKTQSRRSESPAVRQRSNRSDSSQHNITSNGGEMPMYATVDKSRKSRPTSRQSDERTSRHDRWTNGVEKEDPYSRINDDSYVNQNGQLRTEPDYEEVTFRPRSENIDSKSHDSKRRSGDPRRRSSSKESRSSRPSTPTHGDPSYAATERQPSKSMASRGRSYSKESLSSYGNPCVTDADDTIEHLGSSRLDHSSFQSDYDSYKKLSGSQLSILSRTSISEKVEKTKKKLRRALSLDKLSSSNKDSYSFEKPKLKKSPSLRSLTGLLKKKDKDNETEGVFTKRRSASVLGLATTPDSERHPRPQRTTEDTDVTSPTHGRKIGRLLDIKPDSTQIIELVKPPNGPFGFYIAKGTSANGNGIFVTRLGDGHPAKILAGLLQVGDEILEINGQDIRRKKLDDVYDLMMDNDSLVLHVRPLNSRSDYGS